ncbi:hypothetical protein T01_15579 [Trichinella spiralis]|uniref:Uncharacterized protein n=1 Tax=Trichinella spiralis TaxID=6334 RepID=A0A0V0Z1U8_TRISP|nr:hypothetical protein T01_15579 [Trichinella spiralis]
MLSLFLCSELSDISNTPTPYKQREEIDFILTCCLYSFQYRNPSIVFNTGKILVD